MRGSAVYIKVVTPHEQTDTANPQDAVYVYSLCGKSGEFTRTA